MLHAVWCIQYAVELCVARYMLHVAWGMHAYLLQPLGYVARLKDLLHGATHNSALRATAICLPAGVYHLVRGAPARAFVRGFVYCFGE